MKSSVFSDVTPCSPSKVNWRSWGTYRFHPQGSACSPCHTHSFLAQSSTRLFHFQGRRISQIRNQAGSACYMFQARFLLHLFFGPEDEGGMFLRNIGCVSPDCTVLYPRRQNSSERIVLVSQHRWLFGIFQRDRFPHRTIELPVILVDFAECGRYCVI
jgi:hypothetical protein